MINLLKVVLIFTLSSSAHAWILDAYCKGKDIRGDVLTVGIHVDEPTRCEHPTTKVHKALLVLNANSDFEQITEAEAVIDKYGSLLGLRETNRHISYATYFDYEGRSFQYEGPGQASISIYEPHSGQVEKYNLSCEFIMWRGDCGPCLSEE